MKVGIIFYFDSYCHLSYPDMKMNKIFIPDHDMLKFWSYTHRNMPYPISFKRMQFEYFENKITIIVLTTFLAYEWNTIFEPPYNINSLAVVLHIFKNKLCRNHSFKNGYNTADSEFPRVAVTNTDTPLHNLLKCILHSNSPMY